MRRCGTRDREKAPGRSGSGCARPGRSRRGATRAAGTGPTQALPPESWSVTALWGLPEEKLLEEAFRRLDLTARTCHKILRVARTIADLEGEERIRAPHLMEAIGYRTAGYKYRGGEVR